MFNGEMILKYQLMPEDLDVLVTVKSNEDICHMIDECDRHERLGAPRLRAFLFPASPVVMVNSLGLLDRHSIEQRYINSINGIVVCPPPPPPPPVGNNTSCTTFSVSSACSSPPETTSSSITRNHSSPSLSNYGYSSQTNHLNPVATASPNMTRNHHQDPPQPHHVHHQPHLSPKPPLDRHPHKTSGPEHLGRMRATGEAEYYSHRTNKGGHMYSERGSPYGDYCRYDQTDSPPSPDAPSSSHSIWSGR
ncbi:hypothetical protein L1987_85548 [Smallanthus sonchifolius]|uniref:Uncharacterized protein n=1 Tax=Smallanthus sonchifolius TaxID=185202 RepID=A0ACB8XXM9_9ASTR|nr:hypothetical protein L1987_85548 [Smallanthus sonchifolius]